MQFVITGKDGLDSEASERRRSAREAHLEGVMKMHANGALLYAAALCDEQGDMNGSVMIVDFASRDVVDEWLKNEPYIVGKVWQAVEISACQVPPLFLASAQS